MMNGMKSSGLPILQTEQLAYILGCVDANICPECGGILPFLEESCTKRLGDPTYYSCLDCGWNDYI